MTLTSNNGAKQVLIQSHYGGFSATWSEITQENLRLIERRLFETEELAIKWAKKVLGLSKKGGNNETQSC